MRIPSSELPKDNESSKLSENNVRQAQSKTNRLSKSGNYLWQ